MGTLALSCKSSTLTSAVQFLLEHLVIGTWNLPKVVRPRRIFFRLTVAAGVPALLSGIVD